MDIHLLGTTGYHPNTRRQTSCVMIPELGILLDAGTGVFRARDLIATQSLSIFLTHAHLDHCVGLTYFLDILYEKEVAPVTVYGESKKLDAIRDHLFSEHLFPVMPPFSWQPLDETPVALSDKGRLTWVSLDHPGGAVGYRLDWPDKSMAYITDTATRPDAPYVSFIRGVDLLIHECNFPDGYETLATKTGHSCLSEVAEVSRSAQVGMTVLTHFNALNESAAPLDPSSVKTIFEPIFLGEDLMKIEL